MISILMKITKCDLDLDHKVSDHLITHFNALSNGGNFHPLWGKIYPSKDKVKWAAFQTVSGLHFLGNSDAMIFPSRVAISPKWKNLKAGDESQFLVIVEGSLGFGGCCKGR